MKKRLWMLNHLKFRLVFFTILTVFFNGNAVAAPPPVFDFENLLDSYFDASSGLISFGDYTVGFAPESSFDGIAAVVDRSGNVLGQFQFFPEYQNREGVFARVRVQGPADVTLNEAGIYTLVFLISGQPATRLPVKLVETSTGDDPFNPERTWAFDGYWRTMAHITAGQYKGESVPELTFWAGSMDLQEDAFQDGHTAHLFRDGQEVAHSKKSQGNIQSGHFTRTRTSLYHPHAEKKSANAKIFTMKELLIDGSYEIRVNRTSDGQQIRSFDFDVSSGAIEPLARSKMGYQPASDYVMPRVLKQGTTGLEMVEAVWIEDKR